MPDSADPALAMVAFDAEACVNEDYGIAAGDPLAGGWVPNLSYNDTDSRGYQGAAFQIAESGGLLTRLDVSGVSIPTAGGVHVGDPAATVPSAHPDAVRVLESPISLVYQLAGELGDLYIEVAVEGPGWEGYWDGAADTVLIMRVTPKDVEPFAVAGGDNVIFGCAYSS